MDRNWFYAIPLTLVSLTLGFVRADHVTPPLSTPVQGVAASGSPAGIPPSGSRHLAPADSAAPVKGQTESADARAGESRLKKTPGAAGGGSWRLRRRPLKALFTRGRWFENRVADLTDTVRQLERQVNLLEALLHAASSQVPRPADPRLALEWEELGFEFLRAGSPPQARQSFYRALSWNPGDPVLHYNLGVLAQDFLDQPEEALRHYRTFLALSPKDPDAARVGEWVKGLEGIRE